MRTTKETRSRIERAAADSGRSLVQEVEFRLEQSFSDEAARTERLHIEFGGSRTYAFTKLIARLAHDLEIISGAEWTDDSYVFDQLVSGIDEVMNRLRPSDELRRADSRPDALERGMLKDTPPNVRAVLGRAHARGWLDMVRLSQEPLEEEKGPHSSIQIRVSHELGAIIGPLIRLADYNKKVN